MIHSMTDLLAETLNEDFAQLERSVYKYTDCGAWITHDDYGVCVGSIVEGVDEEVQPVELAYPFELDQYGDALQTVEHRAAEIWNETHGCDLCRDFFGWPDDEQCPVWGECPECEGYGAVL